MPIPSLPAILLVAGATWVAGEPLTIMREMPQRGQLRAGQRVLVDDGTCPAGQIREVIGGGNANMRSGSRQAPQGRQDSCIPRP